MTEILLANIGWIIGVLLSMVFYKHVLRVFGVVIVPEDKIGLVTKKFVLFGNNRTLPDGRIIALNGEPGFQAKTLGAGLYFMYWPWQYEIEMVDFVNIPMGKVGIVSAKDGVMAKNGAVLVPMVECDNFQNAEMFIQNGGRKGVQANVLLSGSYRINRNLFDVYIQDQVKISDNKVGIVTVEDGLPLRSDQIAADVIQGHNKFQDMNYFITNGGQRGIQQEVILAGTYNINTKGVKIEEVDMTTVPVGHVGVVISNVGDEGVDVSGDSFKHGNIVGKGQKGVWNEPLTVGKYAINKYTTKVELVPTTNLVLNWANAITMSHNLDKNLSTITIRSSDGFSFNMDVSQIIHVPATEAPKVIARFGDMNNLVSQVLEPTIGNYFRNSAQSNGAVEFISKREEIQKNAQETITKVLAEYNVQAVSTLIGDINIPKELMQPLMQKRIAEEQESTYTAQMKAEVKRQELEKQSAIAQMQGEIVRSEQSVNIAERNAEASIKEAEGKAKSVQLQAQAEAKRLEIIGTAEANVVKVSAEAESQRVKLTAEAEAERVRLTGLAEAESIEAIGKSTAQSYQLQVQAMGENNFKTLKVIESIANNNIKITPDILIGGSNSGAVEGLLGMQLVQLMQNKDKLQVEPVVVPEVKTVQ